MNRTLRTLFVCFAPITLPIYLLYLALATLVAGSYYVSAELTLAPIIRRPVALSPGRFWLLSPLFVAFMPLAVAAQVLVWTVIQFAHLLAALGRWQTGLRRPLACGALGLAWLAIAVWCVVTCVDARSGLRMIGRNVPGATEFDRAARKHWLLKQLPPQMQQRRAELIAQLQSGVDARLNKQSREFLIDELRDDELPFDALRLRLNDEIAGLPWYYLPAIRSRDNAEHCDAFVGALLLAVLLLIRWPGLHPSAMPRAVRVAIFLIRVGVVLAAVVSDTSWTPHIFTMQPPADPSLAARLLQPGLLFTPDPAPAMPDWIALNAALWLLLLGLAAVIWSLALRLRPWLGPPGYYTAYLAVRLLQRKRIAFFSIGAVTLCVAMELIVISVMGGFLDTIRDRSHALIGDLVVEGDLTGFPYYAEFIAEISRWPEMRVTTPIIHSYGVLRFPETGKIKSVEITGIRLDEYRRVNAFGDPDVLFYNTYYPGTTRFAPASQPMYGFDPKANLPVLPEPFESAWKKALAAQPPQTRAEWEDRWTRAPNVELSGPGVFALSKDLQPRMEGRPLPGIIIGRELIARRVESGEYVRTQNYPRGAVCQLSLLPLTRRGQFSSESPPAPLFRYVDDARTGIFEIDNRMVYVDFDHLQDVLSMTPQKRADGQGRTPARASAIHVRLAPGAPLYDVKRRLQEAWDEFASRQPADLDDASAMHNVVVMTWDELQREFINAIQKEKVLTVTMFGIISIVAVLLVLCIFYMIVVEKTRDIGTIKSLGGSAPGVAAVFLTYGAAIGVVGAALGSLLGATFVHHINEVQDWLARMNPNWRVWSPETYSFDKIPDTVKLDELLWIACLAVAASILGAVIPAIRASRTWPVEALRYE